MSGAFGKSSDKKLIERIANADKAAVQALFARYHVRIYRFIKRMVSDETVAKRLANEVFIDVWRQAGRFESRSAVSTWLMAMAHAKSYYWLRNKTDLTNGNGIATPLHDTIGPLENNDLPENKGRSEQRPRKTDKGSALRHAIDRLSADHRAIMDLAYYHELSVREVAKVLEIPARMVKTRMFQARKNLADKLKEAGIDRSWP